MPSTGSSSAGALMPVSLAMSGSTVDMSVPPNVALAELVPAMVKALGPLDSGTATKGFTVRTSDGHALNQSRTLPDQEVRPGAVLTIEPMGSNAQDQRYDDLIEAVGTAVADNSTPWKKTNSVQLSAHASAALVLLAALLLVTGTHEPILTAVIGVSGALLTTLATAIVARMPVTINTDGEDEKIDPTQVYSHVGGARVLVISLKAGCSAAMVVLSPLLTTSPTAVTLLACVGVALMLSTRSLRSPVEVLIGVLTGMFLTIFAAISTTKVIPSALPWTLGTIILAAVLLLATNVVSQKLRPWLTRLADAAGILALLAILPLTALVWGVL